MVDVALVGTGGMLPLPNRFLTSLLIRFNGEMVLIDCGEGTQVSLKLLGWGFKNISVICITHFHADHISGLPGLLLTIGNSGRTEPITIIGNPGIMEVVRSILVIAPELPFDLRFIVFSPKTSMETHIYGMDISAMTLDHRCACLGYSVSVKRTGKFDIERAKALQIPINNWNLLQKGRTLEIDGKTYTPDMVLGDERKGIKVSYVTDTRPKPGIADFAKKSDLFICEGLYGDFEKIDRVREHKHMVIPEACELAKKAEAGELWLTHFSPAMTNPKDYSGAAKAIFENSVIPKDRRYKTILFEDE